MFSLDDLPGCVCLANNAFVRRFGDFGYITNQRTNKDKVYNKTGMIYLTDFITRAPHSTLNIADQAFRLLVPLNTVPFTDFCHDFYDFITDLEKDGFLVTGKDESEIAAKMPRFSYSSSYVKTMPITSLNQNIQYPDTSEYMSKYFREKPHIFSFQFELTSRCNERCRHCYLPGSRNMHDMDTALVIDLLDQLHGGSLDAQEEGTLHVTFSGGECLLHPDFIPILQHARKNDFMISILSNVTMLNDDILQAIKEANIKLLQVSLYSMDPDEHDYITQLPGSLKKTLDSLERLIAADIPVQISCPTMKRNYKTYKEVLKWAYDHHTKGYTDYIMMARTDQSTDNLDCCRMTIEQTRELLEEIVDYDVEYRTLLDATDKFKVPANLANQPVCGAGCDSMCVAADGTFYPCSGFQGYPLGNAKTQTVHDVWTNSPAIKKLREVRWRDFPKCLKCEAKPFCAMCMSRNLNECGSIFTQPQHFCNVAFLNKGIVENYKKKHPTKAAGGR